MITQEIKDFLKESYDLSIPNELPEPVGYNLLVLPLVAKKKVGSIYLPSSNEEKNRLTSVVALVLAVGPDAYDKDRYPNGPWCRAGDFVLLHRDSGNKFQVLSADEPVITSGKNFPIPYCNSTTSIALRLIADDLVQAKLSSYEAIARVELKL